MSEEKTTGVGDALKGVAGLSIGMAVLMIIVGLLAIFSPFAAGLGISILLAWLIVLSGILHLVYAFSAGGPGIFIWRMLIGILYVIGGGYMLLNPVLALQTVTLVVAIILIAEGIFQFIAYFAIRALPGSFWLVIDAIVTIALGILIAMPNSTGWAIGTLFGINLLFSGITRLMLSMTAKKVIGAAAS